MSFSLPPVTSTPLQLFPQPQSSVASAGSNSSQTQNAIAAANAVEQIPQQLQAQAHNWAVQELPHLLNVLRVTLLDDPSSGDALKDLAKGISSDAKNIVTGDSSQGNTPLPSALPANGNSSGAQIDISISETQTTQSVSVSSDGGSSDVLAAVQSYTDTIDVQIQQSYTDAQNTPSSADFTSDANLLGDASAAIGEIKAALDKIIKSQTSVNPDAQAAKSASDDLANALDNMVNDVVTAFSNAPLASIGAVNNNAVNVVA